MALFTFATSATSRTEVPSRPRFANTQRRGGKDLRTRIESVLVVFGRTSRCPLADYG